ncbi:acyl carrier protein [Streptomyces sp. OfavH-34-F]|uniref:acyl carrier protein n=1 Tax=Streptomyces sp. OfavH-34-F TaxID=2917760 RepID=UPI001EF31281|nr:acyl carrier protein [Streptomyces sp. OfavH-34-F]MCG7528707.1 acyl carrier protein [Streptomyces sp. OfavH-34-F]
MSTAPHPATGARARLAGLISHATDGQIPAADILAARGGTLTELGVTSLALLRLADTLEEEYGVELDLADPSFYQETVDSLAARLGEDDREPDE